MNTYMMLSAMICGTTIYDAAAAQVQAVTHAIVKSVMVTVDDYPSAARKANESGLVSIEFTVNPRGRVQDCQIVRSSGSASLDNQTCRISSRIGFKPANDESGKPVSERWQWSINWTDPAKRDIIVGDLSPRS